MMYTRQTNSTLLPTPPPHPNPTSIKTNRLDTKADVFKTTVSNLKTVVFQHLSYGTLYNNVIFIQILYVCNGIVSLVEFVGATY